MGVDIDGIVVVLLFNSVWIIYTIDRILDVKKHKNLSTRRHQMHRKYRKLLIAIVAIMVLINISMITTIELKILRGGLFLGGLVMIYLVIVWMNWKFPKELIIALIYTAGVSLVPLNLGESLSSSTIFLLIQHFFLAFYNLIIISHYEQTQDHNSHQYNIANELGSHFKAFSMVLILGIIFLGIVYLVKGGLWQPQSIYALMLTLLYLVDNNKKYFSVKERYGAWVDAAFLLPLLLLILV